MLPATDLALEEQFDGGSGGSECLPVIVHFEYTFLGHLRALFPFFPFSLLYIVLRLQCSSFSDHVFSVPLTQPGPAPSRLLPPLPVWFQQKNKRGNYHTMEKWGSARLGSAGCTAGRMGCSILVLVLRNGIDVKR